MPLTDSEAIRCANEAIKQVRDRADIYESVSSQPSPAIWLGSERRTRESTYRRELFVIAEAMRRAAQQMESELLPPSQAGDPAPNEDGRGRP